MKKKNELLLQTLLPKALGKWAKAQAKAEGMPLAAWVRRLVIQEHASATSGSIAPSNLEGRIVRLEERIDKLVAAFVAYTGTRDFEAFRAAVESLRRR